MDSVRPKLSAGLSCEALPQSKARGRGSVTQQVGAFYEFETAGAARGLTRAPPGGKYYPPFRDIRHSSEMVLDIDMKLSVPYGTTI